MASGQASPGVEQITLTAKQSNVFVWGWQPECRFRNLVAGRRFGKSFLAAREMKRAAQIAAKGNVSPDEEIWYGAPTFKQAKRVFWPRLKRIIPRHWVLQRREDECTITMVSGHVLRIVGLDNYDDLRGSGLFFFCGDEWADAQPECWTEVIQPMLATSHGHALKIGTPKGYDHFHDDYRKGLPGATESDGTPIEDTRSWKYNSLQGGNIDEAEIARFRRSMDARTFAQEFEADFVNFTGRVLYAFTREKNVRPCPFMLNRQLHIGMDFNINPMSATVWQEDDGKSYQVDEIILETSDTDKMADEIAKRYGRKNPNGGKPTLDHIFVYPDPAGAQSRTSAGGRTDISILRERGFRVVAMSSHPLVRDRINVTNARFENAAGENNAFIDPKCSKSITAYERLAYLEGTNDPDKKSGFDHPVDATGYYMFVRFGDLKASRIKIVGV